MKKQHGFSLIEALVVLAIIAILASVAIASYTSQVQKSRRTDAISALSTLAAQQEKRFFQFNRYEGGINVLNGGTNESPEGYYQLAVNVNAAGGDACNANFCYTLTATALGSQLQDEQCQVFTLDSRGRKTAADGDGNVTTDECWQ